MGSQLPQKKGTAPTQFLPHVYCGQTTVCIRIPLGTHVGLSLGDIVLDGDPGPPPLKGTTPTQFLGNVRCGQTAGWTKMPVAMEIGLGLGDIVLDGDPAPQRKRAQQPPLFGPCHVAKRSPISATAEFLLQKVIKNFGTEDIPIGLFHTSFK